VNERVEVDERAETPTRGAGPRRRWPLLAGATGAALLGAAVWVALHRGAPRLPLLLPAVVAAVALLVGPAAYLAARRFADDPAAVGVARRIAVAAAAMVAAGLVFVGGVEVGRYTGPAPTVSATATLSDPKAAGGDKDTTAVEPFADGRNDLAAAVAVFSIVVPAALAFLGLVVGPWVFLVVRTLTRGLTRERAARARAEERATVAGHLHDSVLQTLSLLQKRATEPGEVVRLARHTERDLRAFLYGPADGGEQDLAGALARVAAGVEDRFDVVVDLVLAGTCPLDERTRAVVGATHEALTNAAQHASVRSVSVFAEVSDHEVLVRVRDRGRGFDQTADTGPDRHGIRDSIVGRMRRHGGQTSIQSTIGEGTEVELRLPVGGTR
jgi:signal transduction histidine kinase